MHLLVPKALQVSYLVISHRRISHLSPLNFPEYQEKKQIKTYLDVHIVIIKYNSETIKTLIQNITKSS